VGYEERNSWVGLVLGVVVLGGYLALLVARADGGPISEVDYQPLLIGAVVVGIVAMIIATIVVTIVTSVVTGEKDVRGDQRDKEIARFGERVGHAFLVIGALAAMLMAMAEWDFFWIANVIFVAFAVSAMVEGIAKVSAYRWGLPQW
jgi:membrane glycosyltransferase